MYGVLDLHTVPPHCVNRTSDRPRAHPVASFQAEAGSLVTNAHHQVLDLDELSVAILRMADGRRTRADLLETVRGTLPQPVIQDQFEAALSNLARNALFVE
jgi:hypothetical protein